jgi:uncharacterized membrane protein
MNSNFLKRLVLPVVLAVGLLQTHPVRAAALQPGLPGQSFAIEDLGVLSGYVLSQANAVNNWGVAVGYSINNDPVLFNGQHASLFSGTSVTDLGGLPGSIVNVANGVNDLGQAVGFSVVPQGTSIYPKYAVRSTWAAVSIVRPPPSTTGARRSAISTAIRRRAS